VSRKLLTPIVLPANPTQALEAATKQYVDTHLTQAEADPLYVNVGGDTMTGTLTLPADPAAAMQAATKQYVDNKTSGAGWAAGTTTVNADGTPKTVSAGQPLEAAWGNAQLFHVRARYTTINTDTSGNAGVTFVTPFAAGVGPVVLCQTTEYHNVVFLVFSPTNTGFSVGARRTDGSAVISFSLALSYIAVAPA
jgi:hypothetical protein